jgi:hypothetical protein
MKIILAILFLVISNEVLDAQVVINPMLPAAGIHLKNQLWNLSIINSGVEQPFVRMEISFSDASNNQQVLTANSAVFRLPKGVKQLQVSDVNPVVYNLANPLYGVDASPAGFLPVGVFTVCYRLIAIGEASTELGTECVNLEIEPISPPILSIPYNEEAIESTHPIFSWIPPAPITSFNNLLYDLVLVELRPKQSSSSGIQQNLPIFTSSNLSVITQPYPASFPDLDTGKIYAWQITAKNNSVAVAKSEIWTFQIKKAEVEKSKAEVGFYAKLQRENDAAYVVTNGQVKFEYQHELNDSILYIKVFDISVPLKKLIKLEKESLPVHFGSNFLTLDITDLRQLISKHIYLLEVSNSQRQKLFLKFEYKQSN